MSEYQYYEFLAIDSPLSRSDIDAVGEFSSRASISSTQFINEYHYGDFKGDPKKFLSKWYDAMLYLANWGTHQFMCRLTLDVVDLPYAKACCAGGSATVEISGIYAIFDFNFNAEDGGDEDDYDGSGYMASIVPVRAELMAGDRRPLYLAWLACAQAGELPDDAIEPAVPPGMKTLTTARVAFADFLRIDDDLIDTAAATSPAAEDATAGLEHWLGALPQSEKDAVLLSLVKGDDPQAAARFRQQFAQEKAKNLPSASGTRTVKQLLDAAESISNERESREREIAAVARAKKQVQAARAREAYLDELATREPRVWEQIDAHVSSKSQSRYDEAIKELKDLKDLAQRRKTIDEFHRRVDDLLYRHAKKPSFVERVRNAALV